MEQVVPSRRRRKFDITTYLMDNFDCALFGEAPLQLLAPLLLEGPPSIMPESMGSALSFILAGGVMG